MGSECIYTRRIATEKGALPFLLAGYFAPELLSPVSKQQ